MDTDPASLFAYALLVIAAYWQFRRVAARRRRYTPFVPVIVPVIVPTAAPPFTPLAFNQPSTNPLTPIGFENHCATLLRTAGWSAALTPHTGDQGADIIARRGEISLVVQCKLYNSPVGNSAVQEAIAARAFYGATHAAVVSNQPYTASARELANRAGVILMAPVELTLATISFT